MYALRSLITIFSVLTLAVFATGASAQERPSYGQEITLANAKKGGKVTGGIGVSGVTSDQDEQVAKAGLEGIK